MKFPSPLKASKFDLLFSNVFAKSSIFSPNEFIASLSTFSKIKSVETLLLNNII